MSKGHVQGDARLHLQRRAKPPALRSHTHRWGDTPEYDPCEQNQLSSGALCAPLRRSIHAVGAPVSNAAPPYEDRKAAAAPRKGRGGSTAAPKQPRGKPKAIVRLVGTPGRAQLEARRVEARFIGLFIGPSAPCLADVDHIVHRDASISIYFMHTRDDLQKPNVLASRIAIDAGILVTPRVGDALSGSGFASCLPSKGVLYACRGSQLVNLDDAMLRRFWSKIFRPNPVWLSLVSRYKNARQAAREFDLQLRESAKTFEMMQVRLFGRATAFTSDQIGIQIIGAACAHSMQDFRYLPKILRGRMDRRRSRRQI